MDPSSVDADLTAFGVEPGETLLYSRLPEPVRRVSRLWLLVWGAINLFATVWSFTKLEQFEWRPFLLGLLFVGLCVLLPPVLLKVWGFVRSRLPGLFRQSVYHFCIITDRGVRLFHNRGGSVINLPWARIDVVEEDFVQGGRGLIFRSDTHDESYALMGGDDWPQPARVVAALLDEAL